MKRDEFMNKAEFKLVYGQGVRVYQVAYIYLKANAD